MAENLLIAITAAIVAWGITSIASHVVKRSRLRNGLLADITIHIAGAKEQNNAVNSLIDDTVKQGEEIPFPISYNVGRYSFYNSIQNELPSYLTKNELVKLIKFYECVWELDVSINGLANTLEIWGRDKIKITESNIRHLKKRQARINSLYEAISTNEIHTISNLPEDYRQVKGPETVVEQT